MIYLDNSKLLIDIHPTALGIINTIQTTDGVILTESQVLYVNHIVSNLISEGIWNKIKALYGFVGGTVQTHRWNWKDMRDLDVAFRLTFPNSMVHDSYGITGNGSNRYANTFFNPSSNLTLSDYHISFFSSKNTTSLTDNRVVGARNGTNNIQLGYRRNGSDSVFVGANNISTGLNIVEGIPTKSTTGYIIGNIYPMFSGAYVNDMFYPLSSVYQSNVLPNVNIYLMAMNSNGTIVNASNLSCGFASIGDGLTDQEAIKMSNIITTAQRILNRA